MCNFWQKKMQKAVDALSTSSSICGATEKKVLAKCTVTQKETSSDVGVYRLDLIVPHPREEHQIRGKDSAPSGYNITLILPQYSCVQSEFKLICSVHKIEFFIYFK